MPEIATPPLLLLMWAAIGYVAGSIPFGIVMARLYGLGDLRKIGSGNIGATNVLRTGNRTAAAATLILDATKGAAVVLVAKALVADDAAQLAALAAFLGHCFPVWLRGRGGKGVATFLGILLAWTWPLGLAACGTWIATALLFRISSLAALVAAAAAPLWAWTLGRPEAVILCVGLAILIYVRHAPNIRRLMDGTESRIGKS